MILTCFEHQELTQNWFLQVAEGLARSGFLKGHERQSDENGRNGLTKEEKPP